MVKGIILGRGVSGKGAAELLSRLKVDFEFYEDGEENLRLNDFDFAVKSPGISPNHPFVRELRERGVKVYGEVELGYRFLRGKSVGITGTNGKSTTTALVYHTLKVNGYRAFVGGNYGIPLSSFALDTDEETVSVLELSSFQIEDLTSFKGEVGALLNVTPDHLDRYSSFKEYLRSKVKIAQHFELLVVNLDDENLKDLKGNRFYGFSLKGEGDFYLKGNELVFPQFKIDRRELPLKGIHNTENYLCAGGILYLLGLKEEEIEKGFKTFKGLPHRVEFVEEVKGVSFINDSKSTNVDSLRKALLSFKELVLIAGGKDKGLDYLELKELIRGKVRALILLGETAKRMEELFKNETKIYRVSSLKEAVEVAFRQAVETGCSTVLFSPGSSSFDMFRNFEERGEAFKREVKKLEERLG